LRDFVAPPRLACDKVNALPPVRMVRLRKPWRKYHAFCDI